MVSGSEAGCREDGVPFLRAERETLVPQRGHAGDNRTADIAHANFLIDIPAFFRVA
jgi:hypothetical protein